MAGCRGSPSSWCHARGALAVLAIAALLSCANATNYTCGGSYGWRRPPATDPNYFNEWAAKYTFYLTDRITFDSLSASSNVVNIGASEYQVCNTSDPGGQYTFSTPVIFSFPEVGDYYFASGIPGDCPAGLKVKITISPSSGGGAPPPPSIKPNYFYVGGESVGWTRPSSATFYQDWADSVAPLYVDSDRVVFEYDNTTHNVAQLSSTAYASCDTSSPLGTFTTGQDVLGPTSAGVYYFSSSDPGDCTAGMRFSIQYVAGSRPAGSISPTSPPPASASPPPFFLPPPVAPVSGPVAPPTSVPSTPPTTSAPPPASPPTVAPASPPIVAPASPPTVPPTSSPPPAVSSPPPVTRPPPPPVSAFPPPPPPPPPRNPPPISVPPFGPVPPLSRVPPINLPPGFLTPPNAATSGARVGFLLLVAALGLPLLVLS